MIDIDKPLQFGNSALQSLLDKQAAPALAPITNDERASLIAAAGFLAGSGWHESSEILQRLTAHAPEPEADGYPPLPKGDNASAYVSDAQVFSASEMRAYVDADRAMRAAPQAAPAAVAVPDGGTPGPWRVRKREKDGEVLGCFVTAPDCQGRAYDADILGDDYDTMERKLADCELIVTAVNAYRAALAATPAAPVAVQADDLAELSMLNKLIDLGSKAAWAHAKSNSDDGPAGTTAYVQWQELRAEMGELIRNHYAATLAAAPVVLPEPAQPCN